MPVVEEPDLFVGISYGHNVCLVVILRIINGGVDHRITRVFPFAVPYEFGFKLQMKPQMKLQKMPRIPCTTSSTATTQTRS